MVKKTMDILVRLRVLLEDRRYECSFSAVSSYAKSTEMSRVL